MDLDKIAKRVASRGAGSGQVRTAGKIEFIRDQGPVRRDIRVKDFDWSPESLRNLAKILWAAQRAHSYAMTAYRVFSKMPSSGFSPDGLLGGRGYIQSVKDMRNGLSSAVEVLSSFTDTVHDEINAEHWRSADDARADALMQNADQVKANPEAFVQDQMGNALENPAAVNPEVEGAPPVPGSDEEEEEGEGEGEGEEGEGFAQFSASALKSLAPKKQRAELPTDDSEQKQGLTESETVMRTTIPESGSYASAIKKAVRSLEVRKASKVAGGDSAIPQDSLPGPRVNRVGPGSTEDGAFNGPEDRPSDDPTLEGLTSGPQITRPVYEDWCADGVSGYENPTDGDSTVLKVSRRLPLLDKVSRKVQAATYSWLPGADNSKNMPYYDRGLTAEDVDWLRDHSQPDPPPGMKVERPDPDTSFLWESQR